MQLIEFAPRPVALAPSAAVLARADEATVVVALAAWRLGYKAPAVLFAEMFVKEARDFVKRLLGFRRVDVAVIVRVRLAFKNL